MSDTPVNAEAPNYKYTYGEVQEINPDYNELVEAGHFLFKAYPTLEERTALKELLIHNEIAAMKDPIYHGLLIEAQDKMEISGMTIHNNIKMLLGIDRKHLKNLLIKELERLENIKEENIKKALTYTSTGGIVHVNGIPLLDKEGKPVKSTKTRKSMGRKSRKSRKSRSRK